MVEIEFDLQQRKTVIQTNLEETFQNVINKYKQKSPNISGSVYYLYNGTQINNLQIKIKNLINTLDQNNKKMKILVYNMEQDDRNNNQVTSQSKDIICPDCKEPCRIMIENYKIKLYDCINGHITSNIKIKDFENTQKINESEIICNICKFKNKGNCPKDEFFYCLTCKQNICLICRPNHDINHNIIKYDQRNYICQIHNEHLIKYCIQCKKNFCFSCEGHKQHEFEDLGNLIPNIEEEKKILLEFRINIDEINKIA